MFFFNDTATTEIYTLSLHDALPISASFLAWFPVENWRSRQSLSPCATTTIALHETQMRITARELDRKSTRLNSSHANISYAVFCLKKKKRSAAGFLLRSLIMFQTFI